MCLSNPASVARRSGGAALWMWKERRRGVGQPDGERRTCAEPVAPRRDVAAVKLDERLHERQAQAQPALAAFERRLRLHERLKQTGDQLRRHPDARVGDADEGFVRRGVVPDPDPRGSPRSVNFLAFWRRFPTTCARRFRSPSTNTGDGPSWSSTVTPHASKSARWSSSVRPHQLVELETVPLRDRPCRARSASHRADRRRAGRADRPAAR